jgi:23S rRNA (uracil1939-C5)-methyltransferase
MVQTLKSVSAAYGGYSIARDDKVVLIRGAIPGELVTVDIVDRKRDYSVATVVDVLEPSPDRVEPPCPVFGVCGGCHLQFVSYERQVALKNDVLQESLSRLGGVDSVPGPALIDSEWNYRRRVQFKVSPEGTIGFFKASSREVVSFGECPLLHRDLNIILRKIRSEDLLRGLTDVHVALGDTPVALLKGRGYSAAHFETLISAGLSGIAYNDSPAYGGAFTAFDLNGLRYTVSPWTFFQAHWELNRTVVAFVASELGSLEGKTVLDLYAGAGNFSLPLAATAAEVIAVEENPYASEDGRRNAELNGIGNCRIVRTSAEKYKVQKKVDVIIIDPPRPGLTTAVMKKVLDSSPERIVYISCNPATLARDLKKMKERYELTSVRLIDFFPQTYHIEAAALLVRR